MSCTQVNAFISSITLSWVLSFYRESKNINARSKERWTANIQRKKITGQIRYFSFFLAILCHQKAFVLVDFWRERKKCLVGGKGVGWVGRVVCSERERRWWV